MIARFLFLTAAAAFFFSTLTQVFLAGMAIFVNPAHWSWHASFVHVFEFIPLLMLLTGWLGRMPKNLLWSSAGLLGLISVQYFNANFQHISPIVAATHPVTALLVVGLAYVTMVNAWKAIQKSRGSP